MPGQVDEIKARMDIVDLIAEYIRLKQAGTNWKALCPFHNEKTPSFMVSRDKQIWHCFGCGEGGDIFTFLQKMESVEFPEALRLLAQKAGVKLVVQDPELASQKNRLLDITQLATKFWHKTLLESTQAKKARDYLKKRQVSDRIIADFKLGYAIDSWDTLIKFLQSRNYTDKEIFLAGLSIKKERGQDFYDRFRDRLIFPINDIHGNPIGFSGRTLKADEKAGKYINTPQTLIYDKSLVVFNLDKAKTEIRKRNEVVITEGQMDVITAYQNGFINTVASSGTALTSGQTKLIKRYTNNFIIALDSDNAGQEATKRGGNTIDDTVSEDSKESYEDSKGNLRKGINPLKDEVNVKVVKIPDGKDPDEFIKSNPDDWLKAVKNAKLIMEYYFDQTLDRFDLNKVEDKKEIARILLSVISKIGNKIEQTHWLQKLAELLKVSEQILRESFSTQKVRQPEIKPQPEISLKYPANIPHLINDLLPEVIADKALNNLYKKLIIYYTEDIGNNIEDFDYQKFHKKLKPDKLDIIADKLVLLAEKDFFDFDSEVIKDELIKTINFCKKDYYTSQLKEIEGKIKQAEGDNQKDKIKELIEQFNEVVTQLNLLD
jgi:DNA primase